MAWLKDEWEYWQLPHTKGAQQFPQNPCNVSIMCIFLVQGKYYIFHLHLEMIFLSDEEAVLHSRVSW